MPRRRSSACSFACRGRTCRTSGRPISSRATGSTSGRSSGGTTAPPTSRSSPRTRPSPSATTPPAPRPSRSHVLRRPTSSSSVCMPTTARARSWGGASSSPSLPPRCASTRRPFFSTGADATSTRRCATASAGWPGRTGLSRPTSRKRHTSRCIRHGTHICRMSTRTSLRRRPASPPR